MSANRQTLIYEDSNGNKKEIGRFGTSTIAEFDEAISHLPSLIAQAREGNQVAGKSARDLLWQLANEVATVPVSFERMEQNDLRTLYAFGR